MTMKRDFKANDVENKNEECKTRWKVLQVVIHEKFEREISKFHNEGWHIHTESFKKIQLSSEDSTLY